MRYLKINPNQEITYPYEYGMIRIENPNVSFPQNINYETLNSFGVYYVNDVILDKDYTKNYTEGIPQLINGQYFQNWIATDATQEEIDQRIESQWVQVKSIRNQYLAECDWTQLPDSPLTTEKKQEWATYRQELRDITLQPDPFNVNWPIKPS